jgi:hypothetical protein
MRDTNRILEVIQNGTLHEEAPFDYPDVIKDMLLTDLMKHQLQSIFTMNQLENKVPLETNSEYLVSEIGVLANTVGSGKSLCILGLIAKQPKLESKDVVKEYHGEICIMKNRVFRVIQSSNLVVVPHHILRSVWLPYLKHTNIKYIIVTKYNVCNDILKDYTIVLCSSKYYNTLIKNCSWVWSRVIFDEADTLNIPACIKPNTSFVWFITSSIQNLVFYQGYYWKWIDGSLTRVTTRGIVNQGYIKNTFRNLKECPLLQNIIIKFNDKYLKNQLNLPPIIYQSHTCKQPFYLPVVYDIVPDNVLYQLHGDDINGAMEFIGYRVDITTNIIAIILSQLNEKLIKHNLKKEYLLQLQNTIIYPKENDIGSKIIKNDEYIRQVQQQIVKINDRVSFVFDNEIHHICPICMDDTTPETTCIFSCCLNLFCSNCVTQVVQYSIKTCPLCRTTINCNNIFKKRSKNHLSNLDTKNNTLLKLLINIHNDFHEYHILIFAMYEESMLSIQTALFKSKLQFKTIRGNNIHNVLTWFNSTKSGILVINANTYGSGLNIHKSTHIIMYQQFTQDLTMQIIGRAHRIGRSKPLHVHTLEYTNTPITNV